MGDGDGVGNGDGKGKATKGRRGWGGERRRERHASSCGPYRDADGVRDTLALLDTDRDTLALRDADREADTLGDADRPTDADLLTPRTHHAHTPPHIHHRNTQKQVSTRVQGTGTRHTFSTLAGARALCAAHAAHAK
jgi:hypothetical protein